MKLSTIVDVLLKFVFKKESSDFGVLYVVCLATNARLHHHVQCTRPVLSIWRFFNSHRGARQILRETKQILRDSKQLLQETNNRNKPSNGAIEIQNLGKVTENLLWETIFLNNVINSHNIAFNGVQSENFVDKACAITRNIRQANHILAMYMIIELL